jgi:hypothetical protein
MSPLRSPQWGYSCFGLSGHRRLMLYFSDEVGQFVGGSRNGFCSFFRRVRQHASSLTINAHSWFRISKFKNFYKPFLASIENALRLQVGLQFASCNRQLSRWRSHCRRQIHILTRSIESEFWIQSGNLVLRHLKFFQTTSKVARWILLFLLAEKIENVCVGFFRSWQFKQYYFINWFKCAIKRGIAR